MLSCLKWIPEAVEEAGGDEFLKGFNNCRAGARRPWSRFTALAGRRYEVSARYDRCEKVHNIFTEFRVKLTYILVAAHNKPIMMFDFLFTARS